MLAQLLEKHGLPAKIQPFADVASAKALRIDARDAPLVCLSYFGAVRNPAHVRFLIRRLKRLMPNAKFLAGYWMLGEDPEKGRIGKMRSEPTSWQRLLRTPWPSASAKPRVQPLGFIKSQLRSHSAGLWRR